MIRAALIVLYLLFSAATASAECAWVLWVGKQEERNPSQFLDGSPTEAWRTCIRPRTS
jgi:hypothetical protein